MPCDSDGTLYLYMKENIMIDLFVISLTKPKIDYFVEKCAAVESTSIYINLVIGVSDWIWMAL